MEKYKREQLIVDANDVIELIYEGSSDDFFGWAPSAPGAEEFTIRVRKYRVEKEPTPEWVRLRDEYDEFEADKIFAIMNGEW